HSHIVSRQINVGVAIQYLRPTEHSKIWDGKSKPREPNVLCARRANLNENASVPYRREWKFEIEAWRTLQHSPVSRELLAETGAQLTASLASKSGLYGLMPRLQNYAPKKVAPGDTW